VLSSPTNRLNPAISAARIATSFRSIVSAGIAPPPRASIFRQRQSKRSKSDWRGRILSSSLGLVPSCRLRYHSVDILSEPTKLLADIWRALSELPQAFGHFPEEL
jgi:hypothetical protein